MEMTRIFLPLSELTGRVLSLGSLSISGVGLLVCFEPAIVARHALPSVDRACDVLCVRPARDSQLILAFLQRFELVADAGQSDRGAPTFHRCAVLQGQYCDHHGSGRGGGSIKHHPSKTRAAAWRDLIVSLL
jgi:hypothetical protein